LDPKNNIHVIFNPFNFLDMVHIAAGMTIFTKNYQKLILSNNTTGKLKMKQIVYQHGVYYLFESTNLYKSIFILDYINWNILRARIAFQQEKSQHIHNMDTSWGATIDCHFIGSAIWKDCEGKNKSPQKAQWHKLKRKILGILGLDLWLGIDTIDARAGK
ncbi:hypothetical protein ACJX0J_016495, partial [Zea mays]